jgi:hypothetical protein
MQEQTLAEITKVLSIDELKQFAKEAGPCLTITSPSRIPGGESKKLTSRLKRQVHEAEQKLAERGYDLGAIQVLVEPVLQQIEKITDEADIGAESVVFFASPGEARHYWVPRPLDETVAVGDNFHIRPLIPILNRDKEFYVLAIAQKHLRLLRCTEFTSEEVALPDNIATNLRDDTQTRKPDHTMDNRVTPGPSAGSSVGVMFGTNTDKEDRDQYLHNWFRDVARGVSEVLKGSNAALILCCVEYEQPTFRDSCTYPNLVEEGVIGAPDSFKGGELHKRALEVLQRHIDKRVDEALKPWDKQTGEYAKAGVKDIVKAAYEGRVMTLFVADSAQVMGNFNELTFSAEGSQDIKPWDEDLLNAAALQTIAHGGTVYVVPQSKIPENRPMAAIMRY